MPNSFYEDSDTLLPKSHKDPTKNENYRSIILMNIDVKIFNKILATQIKEYNKRSSTMNKQDNFHLHMETHTHTQSRIAETILNNKEAENVFDKIQHPFMVKVLKGLGYKGHILT